MTEATSLTGKQIKAALPKLSAEELEEVSSAVVKEASKRIRTRKPNSK